MSGPPLPSSFNLLPVLPSSSHPVFRSSSHPVIPSSRLPVFQSSSHPVFQSSSHPVFRSSSHPVFPSSSHPVIPSSGPPVIPSSRLPVFRSSRLPVSCVPLRRAARENAYREDPSGSFVFLGETEACRTTTWASDPSFPIAVENPGNDGPSVHGNAPAEFPVFLSMKA